jgi:hypothetical protein
VKKPKNPTPDPHPDLIFPWSAKETKCCEHCPGENHSLEEMVREIVQREIRLATVASIKQAVKRELKALEGYGKAASRVAADLKEMGLDDGEEQ